jgi:class 3 adenylate cyclase
LSTLFGKPLIALILFHFTLITHNAFAPSNSWGGTANKNIGDAFLVTWLLDEEATDGGKEEEKEEEDFSISTTQVMFSSVTENLYARNNQAERALLAVVKISIALHYDNFFVESLNEEARNRLLTKLSKRKGPIVQM